MSSQRQKQEYQQRRELQSAGFGVEKGDTVAFHSSEETHKHIQTKVAAGIVLQDRGYRVDSEVPIKSNGQVQGTVDLLGYGREDGDIIIVEAETSPTKEVVREKIQTYVNGLPPRECFILNTNDCPTDFTESVEWVRGEL